MFKKMKKHYHKRIWFGNTWAFRNLTVLGGVDCLFKAEYHESKYVELGGSSQELNDYYRERVL